MTWIKVSDEPSRSPFMARIWMGMFQMRDQFYLLNNFEGENQQKRTEFDKKFGPVLDAARAVRDSGKKLIDEFNEYFDGFETKVVIKGTKGQVNVTKTIDAQLKQEFAKVIDQGVVAIKSNLQELLRTIFAIDIGFLFKKENSFNQSISDLKTHGEETLADYLQNVRNNWLQELLSLRNVMEHAGWLLADMEFIPSPDGMLVKVPEINGQPVNLFVLKLVNRILLFIENMMVFGMQKTLPYPVYVTEIPLGDRNLTSPVRFRLSAHGLDNAPAWQITFIDGMDFLDMKGSIIPQQ